MLAEDALFHFANSAMLPLVSHDSPYDDRALICLERLHDARVVRPLAVHESASLVDGLG